MHVQASLSGRARCERPPPTRLDRRRAGGKPFTDDAPRQKLEAVSFHATAFEIGVLCRCRPHPLGHEDGDRDIGIVNGVQGTFPTS